MSYLVLARKYRPRRFEELVGQEHVVQALANALRSQRLHHAYLFTGTRGVGKTTVSRILAKSLNCVGPDGQGGITAEPCGVCSACTDIDAGRHVDYVELDAASNRGVDEISQLLDQAVYKPVVGRFKVYMIDEVHMLSNTAFNAMLKTLEEPPEYLKFVLATTDPQKVPPTVLSRCLQFNLRPMAPATVQQHLARVLGEERIEADAGAMRLLARAAQGSMRDALSLADQAIAFGAGTLREASVREMLGAVDRGHAVRVLDALAAGDGAGLVAAADGLRALGLSASGLLEELAAMLQQMAVLQAVPEAADEGNPETPALRRLAAAFRPDETQLHYSIALHARAELALAPDEYAGLVMALLRMLAFRPGPGETAERPALPQADAEDEAPSRALSAALVAAPPSRTQVPVPPRLTQPEAATGPWVRPAAPTGPSARPAAATEPSARPAPATAPALRAVSAAEQTPSAPVTAPAFVPTRATLAPEPLPAAFAAEPASSSAAVAHASSTLGTEPELAGTPAAVAGDPGAGAPPIDRSLGDRWAAVVAQLTERASIAALTRELALQAELVAVEAQGDAAVWRLRVERESLRGGAPREKLQAALAALLEAPVRLELEAGAAADSPALREAAENARRQREAERIIRDDPLVQSLMQQYKTARIVPGSIKYH